MTDPMCDEPPPPRVLVVSGAWLAVSFSFAGGVSRSQELEPGEYRLRIYPDGSWDTSPILDRTSTNQLDQLPRNS